MSVRNKPKEKFMQTSDQMEHNGNWQCWLASTIHNCPSTNCVFKWDISL